MKRIRRLRGFTLVEIALVLVIVSLLLGAGIAGFKGVMESNRYAQTKKALSYTKQSLLSYVNLNNFLPCPDVNGDGHEDRNTATTPYTCKSVEGTVPYKDIGLNIGQVRDAWGNVFLYHVNERVTTAKQICDAAYSSSFFCNCKPDSVKSSLSNCQYGPPAFMNDTPPTAQASDSKNLVVKDAANGTATADQLSVVVLAKNANAGAQCKTLPADEQENCNGDGVFVSHERTDDPFFDDQLITISGYEIRKPALTHNDSQTQDVTANLQSLFAQSLKTGIQSVTVSSNMDPSKRTAMVNFLAGLDQKLAKAETPLLDTQQCAAVPAEIADTSQGDVKVIKADFNQKLKLDSWRGVQLLGHLLKGGSIKAEADAGNEKYVYVQKSALGEINLKNRLTGTVIAGIAPGKIRLDAHKVSGSAQTVRICGDLLIPSAGGGSAGGCSGLQSPEPPTTAGAKHYGDRPPGWHKIVGTSHDDVVVAGDGWPLVDLLGGNNHLTIGKGGDGWVQLKAGSGDDHIQAGDHWSFIDVGSGDDNVIVGSGSVRIEMGPGNDRLQAGNGGAGFAQVNTGSGDDQVRLGDDFDKIDLGPGDDKMISGKGSTQVFLGSGADCAQLGDAGVGFAKIDAGPGDDRVTAGNGYDAVYLGSGDDHLWIGNGDPGWTMIYGGPGNDVITVGYGFKKIDGGSGHDVLIFRGKPSDYKVETKWGRKHVIHKATGRDSWLYSIEEIRFTNGSADQSGSGDEKDHHGDDEEEHDGHHHSDHGNNGKGLFVLSDFNSQAASTELLVRDRGALSVNKAQISDGNGFAYLFADPVSDENYSVLHDLIKLEGPRQTLAVVGPLGSRQQVESHDKPNYHHWNMCQTVMQQQSRILQQFVPAGHGHQAHHVSKAAKVVIDKANTAALLVLGNCAAELDFGTSSHDEHGWMHWFGKVSVPSPIASAYADDEHHRDHEGDDGHEGHHHEHGHGWWGHENDDHDHHDDDHHHGDAAHVPGGALFILVDQVTADTATKTGYPIGYGGNVYPSCRLNTFDADDLIVVQGSLFADMNTAGGDDVATIHAIASDTVKMGDGNDSLTAQQVEGARIKMEAGNDLASLQAVGANTEIEMGAGDDQLTIAGTIATSAQLDGGAGNDTLVLKTYDATAYQAIKDQIYGFETIRLSDGTVITP